MPPFSSWPKVAAVVATVVTATACAAPASPVTVTETPAPPTTAAPSSTTTTVPTAPEPEIDWNLIRSSAWLLNGPDGILTDTGQVLWETTPALGESAITRDGTGGFVWVDRHGLWWLPAGAPQPRLVTSDTPGHLIGVTSSDDGPVAVFEASSPRFVDLTTGGDAPPPPEPRVRLEGAEPAVTVIRAMNGLEARVVPPVVTFDAEGQPTDVTEPARLVVTDRSGSIVDVPVGSFYSPSVTLHDFDGRRVVLSRGPFEPALPEESFFVVDLACGSCLARFGAAATGATLVGSDADWDGSNPDLLSGILTAAWLRSDAQVDHLTDGTYLGFLIPEGMTPDELSFDLAVWFSGPDANVAAAEDGETDLPVPDDYYIRNTDPTVFTVSVASDVVVTSVWFDYDTDPDLASDPVPYPDLVEARTVTDGPRAALWYDPWWVTISDGEVVRLDEQYVP